VTVIVTLDATELACVMLVVVCLLACCLLVCVPSHTTDQTISIFYATSHSDVIVTKAGQDTSGQDTSGQDTSGQDTSGQDTSGQDTSGQDTSGQDTDVILVSKKIEMVWSVVWEGTQTNKQATSKQTT
jgi:hypothetical protein